MGEVKHTPGPWRLEYDGFDEALHVTCDDRSDRVQIAIVSVGYSDAFEAEQQANARLIAAAPEMLDAIKAIQRHIDDPAHYNRHIDHLCEAAIAKAEGRS